MLRRNLVTLVIIFVVVAGGTSFAQSSLNCDNALVKSTYSRVDDTRLAVAVSREAWDEIKHNAGANAIVYGVPVGGSYDDFHSRSERTASSLTDNQRRNIMWTGLDPQSGSDYQACLTAYV